MAKTIEQLKAQGAEVKNATVVGENTATRVGTLFTDIVEHVEQYEAGQTEDTEANALAISNEAQARAKADEGLNRAIVAETNRAKAAEETNAQDIADEKAAIMGTDRIADGAITIEKLADIAIDDEPTAGSDNLVKSGGVANKLAELEGEVYDEIEEDMTPSEIINDSYINTNYEVTGNFANWKIAKFVVNAGDKIHINSSAFGGGIIVWYSVYNNNTMSSSSSIAHGQTTDNPIDEVITIPSEGVMLAVQISQGYYNASVKSIKKVGKIPDLENRVVQNTSDINNNTEKINELSDITKTIYVEKSIVPEPRRVYNDSYLNTNGEITGNFANADVAEYVVNSGDKVSIKSVAYGGGIIYWYAIYNSETMSRDAMIAHGQTTDNPIDIELVIPEGGKLIAIQKRFMGYYADIKKTFKKSIITEKMPSSDYSEINVGIDGDSITCLINNWSVWVEKLLGVNTFSCAMSNATWQDQVVHYAGQTFTPQTDVTSEDYVGYDAIQTPTSSIEAQKIANNRARVHILDFIDRVNKGINKTPDLFIFALGVNDAANGNDSTTFAYTAQQAINTGKNYPSGDMLYSTAGCIKWCIQKIQETYPKTKIVLLTPMQAPNIWNDFNVKVGDMIKEIGAAMSVPVIDLYNEVGISLLFENEGASGMCLYDGLHPNDLGREKQGRFVAAKLRSLFF